MCAANAVVEIPSHALRKAPCSQSTLSTKGVPVVATTKRLLCISVIGLSASLTFAGVPAKVKPAKNIIIMIPDGMSVSGTTLARWMNGGDKPLAMDDLACGLVRTYPSDAIINISSSTPMTPMTPVPPASS
jgi:alkaline phosphatase